MINTTKVSLYLKKIIFTCAILLVAVTPFIFTWFNSELFEFNKMMFVYLLTTIITASWLAIMIIEKKLSFKHTTLDIPWLLFLIAQILATIFSMHLRTSIFGYYSRFNGGLLSSISYALLYWSLISNLNHKQILALIKIAVLAALGASWYAIPERLGFSPSCVLITHSFSAGVNCWIQDVQTRVFATFGQPNWLGAYLGMLLPLAMSFYLTSLNNLHSISSKTKSLWLQMMRHRWLGIVISIFIALLFTQSRSALLGFSISLIFLISSRVLISLKHKQSFKAQHSLIMLILILVIITFSIGTSFIPSFKNIMSQFQTEPQANDQVNPTPVVPPPTSVNITPSEKIRLIVWRGAIKVWQRYPWLGAGPETFAYSYYLDRPLEHNLVSEWDFLYNKAHNEWLNLLANTGVIGLITYLILMGATFILAGRILCLYWKKNNQVSIAQTNLVLGISAGLIGFNITNLLGFSTVMVSVLWVSFMIGLSSLFETVSLKKSNHKLTNSHPSKQSHHHKLDLIRIITLIWLAFVTLYFLLNIVRIWQADYYFNKGQANLSRNKYAQAIQYLQKAVLFSSKEALFFDELADAYAKTAVQLYLKNELEFVPDYTNLALAATFSATELNPHNINFYKTQSSIFSQLAVIDDQYLQQAKEALIIAQAKAPTDPKLLFQQGLIELAMDSQDEAIASILTAIKMKPNYHQARYRLGLIYEAAGQCPEALEQYQFILDYLIPGDENLQAKIKNLNCSF